MCRTTSSIRSLSRELRLEIGASDPESALRDYDRRETEAVVTHLLGARPRPERR